LVGLSSSNPIRWRPCADPVQKRDPGDRITQKGLTFRGPLQKGMGLGQPQRQLPLAEFMPLNEVLHARWRIGELQIASAADFAGNRLWRRPAPRLQKY
jgi:hypothetical protein